MTKKLHPSLKSNSDDAVNEILQDPFMGELKKEDLSLVRVYKFEINHQKQCLAYVYEENVEKITLLAMDHTKIFREI